VEKVFQSGEPFSQNEKPLSIGIDKDGNHITQYINYLSQAFRDDSGKVLSDNPDP
jgi:hypothetical protein